MKSEMIARLKRARRCATSIVVVNTADPGSTIEAIAQEMNGTVPVVWWNCGAGWLAMNEAGEKALTDVVGADDDARMVERPEVALRAAREMPKRTVVILQNLNSFLTEGNGPLATVVAQALWNLREPFKIGRQTAVIVGPAWSAPQIVAQDCLVIEEELPTAAEHEAMIRQIAATSEVTITDDEARASAVQMRGLGAYGAEQAASESLKEEAGVDMPYLIGRKAQMFEAIDGLTVARPTAGFEIMGGYEAAKQFFLRKINGRRPPACLVFVDELEKAGAGMGRSGGGGGEADRASVGILRYLLVEMQNNGWSGSILLGPPGSGKTSFAFALAFMARVLMLNLDVGALFGQYLGTTEERSRAVMRVLRAVGGRDVYWVATSNNLGALPTELLRRFSDPTWFFDVPNGIELVKIWRICLRRYGLLVLGKTEDAYADDLDLMFALQKFGAFDTNWVGSDVETCCRLAWEFDLPVHEAAGDVVSVFSRAGDQIDKLRREAHGKYRNASAPGMFSYSKLASASSTRRIEREGA